MTKAWSNLASVVYRRTYSRKDHGVNENWGQTVDRYVGGNIRGFDVPEEEIKQLLRYGKDRKAIPAGRGLWFSGSPAHQKIGGAANCNCFAGNERLITRYSTPTFKDVVDTEVEVLDGNKNWVKATIHSFGVQPVYRLTLRRKRKGKWKRIKVTADHTWYARRSKTDPLEKVTTLTLPIGGYIPRFTSKTPPREMGIN